VAIWKCAAFFDGVSGMWVLAKRFPEGMSMLRLRLEIRPVDMKACGNGLAILYAAGVAKESCEDASLLSGLSAPSGRDLEKPGGFDGFVSAECCDCCDCCDGCDCSSIMLDAEDEGVKAWDKGCGFGAD